MTALSAYWHELHAQRSALIALSVAKGDTASVARLVAWADIRICCSKDLHRRYWKYAGQQAYSCEICEKIGIVH